MERAPCRALNGASRVEMPRHSAMRDSRAFAEFIMPGFSRCIRADRHGNSR